MLSWIINRKLAAFEKQYGYDMGYARELLAIDRGAFFAFARVSGISEYKKDVPRDVYYAAKLVATLAEDCGPCTQLVVAMALEDKVEPRGLSAVIAGDDAALTADQRLAADFARTVLAHDLAADEHRDRIVEKWGKRALVALSFAIVAGRLYPTLKYALGHGRACARVDVAGTVITPRSKAADPGAATMSS